MNERKKLLQLFKELNLKSFAEQYEEVITNNDQTTDNILLELCKSEVEEDMLQKVKSKIKHASFPKTKTLAMLDYNKAPKLPKRTVETLATCAFIKQNENLILIGDSGGGKTHLAIALGIEACKKNFRVKFFTACQLVNILLEHYEHNDIEKFMTKLKRYSLIIIDEIGYVPFSKKGAELLFQVFSDRYESGSVIVTSNLNFSQWTEVFIEKTMTTALLDRLAHHATIIKYDWGSIRFNQAVNRKKKQNNF